MKEIRKNGYYFVTRDNVVDISYFYNGNWYMIASEKEFKDEYFDNIGDMIMITQNTKFSKTESESLIIDINTGRRLY